MTTLLYTHPAAALHDTGPGHPERPARLMAIETALADPAFGALERRPAPAATRAQLERVHPPAHVDRVLAAVPEFGHALVDMDTILSPGSALAAHHAAGAAVAAVDAVMAGEAANAFCALRPPGHHAEPTRAMGFCLFNNAAVAAAHAHAVHGLSRVAVVDFDVHHGNGTQAAAEDAPWLFYASSHEMPLFPGTGRRHERGRHLNVFNVPLPPGTGSRQFRHAWEVLILPELEAWRPQLLILSAGFDAHANDPLASLELAEEDFAWITRVLTEFAGGLCGGRVVSVLEGGYDLDALGASVAAHVRTLMIAGQ